METKRVVAVIGAALDLGQGRRGVDLGPSAIRYAGLEERLQSLGFAVRDHGNVETNVPWNCCLIAAGACPWSSKSLDFPE